MVEAAGQAVVVVHVAALGEAAEAAPLQRRQRRIFQSIPTTRTRTILLPRGDVAAPAVVEALEAEARRTCKHPKLLSQPRSRERLP